jgi:hypothetical protein
MDWEGPMIGLLKSEQNFLGRHTPIIVSDIENFRIDERSRSHILEHFASGTDYSFLRPPRSHKTLEPESSHDNPETQPYLAVPVFRITQPTQLGPFLLI